MDFSTEKAIKPEDSRNPSSMASPRNCNGSAQHRHQIITRSDHYPTTFVQADTSTFKQVVQMLTGSSETAKQASSTKSQDPPPPAAPAGKGSFVIPPIKTPPPKKHTSFKLYERRHNSNLKNSLMISTLMTNGGTPQCSARFSPRNTELLSPSCLDFPNLALSSPVTPLNSNDDPFNKSSPLSSLGNSSEGERAIAEKGFYFHPSPISTPRDSEPQLLPLFPMTSPRVSSPASTS